MATIKCANCKKEFDRAIIQMITTMKANMHYYVCSSECLKSFYETKKEADYKLSKDYDRLYDFICTGKVAVGFVDYKFTSIEKVYRDVCKIRQNTSYGISVSVRGCCYFEIKQRENRKELFVELCEADNLEFIDWE